MRRIALLASSTVAVLVLLFTYPTSTSSRFAQSADDVLGARAAGPQPLRRSGTFDGDVVTTRFGVVQVRIVVSQGRIVSSEALQVPNGDRHDLAINSRAAPLLAAEVLAAQSARIDLVSGATLTSQGYVRSLQSAIDRASA